MVEEHEFKSSLNGRQPGQGVRGSDLVKELWTSIQLGESIDLDCDPAQGIKKGSDPTLGVVL